jgi:Flp pilus assembly protein TadB/Mg-chelatase subunit ChlD
LSRLRLAVPAVAAGVAVAFLLLAATPALAAPNPTLKISGVEPAPGIVRFVLTARDVEAGTELDPAKVAVAVGTTKLAVDATKAYTKLEREQLPPRGIIVIIDASGSFDDPAKLGAAKAAAGKLAADLPADVVLGLVTVSDKAVLAVTPTVDRKSFTTAVAKLKAGGNTPLYDGVALAQSSLAVAGFTPGSDQRVVVLSDGLENNSKIDRAALLRNLKAAELRVDTIAFQAPPDGRAELKAIADASGGRTKTVQDASGIAAGFQAAGASFSVVLAVAATVPNELANTTSTMEVTTSVQGTVLSAQYQVTFAGPVNVPTVPKPILGWVPDWMTYAAAGAVGLAVLILILGLTWPRSRKRERIAQIAHFGPARTAPAAARRESESAGGVLARTALAATASMVGSGRLQERIGMRLEQAGMRLKPQEWVLLRLCVMITLGSLLFLVVGWIGVGLGLLLGWLVTMFYRLVKVDRRSREFAEALPDALQIVTGSLRSGFSLQQALESLVRESTGPVAAEFGRAMAEHRLGADISEALERMVVRTRSEDLGWAVIAVRIQREVGGNLAEVLQTAVDTMRERGRLRRHVRSLSAEGRLSAWILIGLPVLIAGSMFAVRRDYLTPLYTQRIGLVMLLVGLVLFVLGIIWITRVVKVEA